MAKLKMQKLRITALGEQRKAVLEKLQQLGVVEPLPVAHDDIVASANTQSQQKRLADTAKTVGAALELLDEYSPEKKPFLAGMRGRPVISDEEFDKIGTDADINYALSLRIIRESKQIDELNADSIRRRTRLDSLTPWLGLDLPMRFSGTEYSCTLIGTVPNVSGEGELLAGIARLLPDNDRIDIEKVGSSGDMCCFAVTCLRSERTELENALRMLGFTRPAELCDCPPAEEAEKLRAKIADNSEKIENLSFLISLQADKRKDLKYLLDSCNMRLEKYEAIEKLGITQHSFILEGWTPENCYDKVCGEMEALGAFCEKIEPGKKELAPVLLKNNSFFEGGEPILEMYSLPSKNDIDPTPVMALFYYLLFGIMLGDAAYGLIMVAATLFVLLKLKPEGNSRKNMKLFCFSGVSATIWGILFGSFFGDLPNVIARTFFGATENVLKPLLFDPISEPMAMMIFSIAVGVVHIFTGLVMGVITSFKNKDAAAAIFDYFSWFTLLFSLIAWALLTLLGDSLPFVLPEFVSTVLLGLAILSVAVIFIMNGRRSKNLLVRLLKGAYALYGITSYLSDFVSYSRLLALALATGVISQVFNQMAAMFGGGGGIPGILIMVIVCLIGHAFNIGISLIGCYVHTSRLQYIEFFGKFYEGGGLPFTPLAVNTKNFKFTEEN